MAKIFDEIYEDLKREDMMRRLVAALPWLALVAVMTLVGTGIYVWRSSVQEAALVQGEKLYYQALKTQDPVKRQELLDKIPEHVKGLRTLVLLQTYALTAQPLAKEKIYAHLKTQGAPTALLNLLTLDQAMHPQASSAVHNAAQSMLTPGHSCYPLALAWQAVHACHLPQGTNKQPDGALSLTSAQAFARWQAALENSDFPSLQSLLWMVKFARMGLWTPQSASL